MNHINLLVFHSNSKVRKRKAMKSGRKVI